MKKEKFMATKHPVTDTASDTTTSATPDAAVERYVTVLLRWEELTRRQQAYEHELAKLEASGDKLRPEWEALADERRASLVDLQALTLPLDTVIMQVWGLFKVQLHAVYAKVLKEHGTPHQGSAFFALRDAIEALVKPLALNQRIEG